MDHFGVLRTPNQPISGVPTLEIGPFEAIWTCVKANRAIWEVQIWPFGAILGYSEVCPDGRTKEVYSESRLSPRERHEYGDMSDLVVLLSQDLLQRRDPANRHEIEDSMILGLY